MEINKVALIELGGSHDECLYSQVLFLKKYDCQVDIVLYEDHFHRIFAFPEVDSWKCYKKPSGWFAEWKLVFKLLKYLKRQGIKTAVLNTAEGNIIRKLSLAGGKFTAFTGIIHLSSKLRTSISQRIISRKVKRYFVLADFIKENLVQAGTNVAIEGIYPIHFPAGNLHSARPEMNGKKESEFQICIPGAVDFARRDYLSLLDEMQVNKVPNRVRFILLGRSTSRDGQLLKDRIAELGFDEHFALFEDFIPHAEFYEALKNAWLVLPLITPRCKDYSDYLEYKITGSFNLAYGFHLPMLQHKSFARTRIYRETSVFYEDGNLLGKINQCLADVEMLQSIRERISILDEFRFDFQAEKYMNFISG